MNKKTKCAACGKLVMVDQFGQGDCHGCGWYQGENDLEQPDIVRYPNMVSLNRARQLIAKGQPLKPTFDEFIKAFLNYGEMDLSYQGHHFGIIFDINNQINFYEKNISGTTQFFKTPDEFIQYASINGKLIKNIWDEIDNPNYM